VGHTRRVTSPTGPFARSAVRSLGLILSVCLATLVGCGTDDGGTSDGPGEPAAASADAERPDSPLHIDCRGDRDSDVTVVLVAGVTNPGAVFVPFADRLAKDARTCFYDRAGLGQSPALGPDDPAPTPGSAAEDLHTLLAAERIDGPLVVLGWSYGGLIAQAFTTAHPDRVEGLVLVDPSTLEQFTEPDQIQAVASSGLVWNEGGRDIDTATLVEQIAAVDLGDVPTVMLSLDLDARPEGERWYEDHDRAARLSSDAVHAVGVGSGHAMHVDVPDLVAAAVRAALTSAREGTPVAPCDERFTSTGGRCRDL
jgi:pimeloyl-ACP methyl ester carboxylesterase